MFLEYVGGLFRPVLKLINFKSALAPAKALQLMSWAVQHFVETHLHSTHRQDVSSDSLSLSLTKATSPSHTLNNPAPSQDVLREAVGDENLKQRILSDLIKISSKTITFLQDPDADSVVDSPPSCVVSAEHLDVRVMECGAVRPLPLQQHHLAAYRHVIGAEDMSILRLVD